MFLIQDEKKNEMLVVFFTAASFLFEKPRKPVRLHLQPVSDDPPPGGGKEVQSIVIP